MKPTTHLVLTIMVFVAAKIYTALSLNVLFFALLLTVIVDIMDHSLIILLINNEVTIKTRELASALKLNEAYRIYCKERYKTGRAFMHNLAFFAVITALGVIYKSPVILLGISFHFVCDMMSDFYFMKRLNDNWTFAFLLKKQRKYKEKIS